jgi:hypothetical protein
MARFLRPFVSTVVTLVTAGLVVSACSSDNADDGGLASAGGSSAQGGTGGSSTGGSSATGGSSTGGSSTGGSSATGGSSTGGSANSTSTGGSGGTGGSGTGGSSGGNGGSGAYPMEACQGLDFDADGQGGEGGDGTCTGVSNEAESVPVDLFIMMDRSVSMANVIPGTSMTRWQALQQAVEEFASSSSGDIRAGIGFFGVTGGQDDDIDCDTSRYATPSVEIGDLADVGDDLVAAMTNMKPGGLTPAGPALAGALEYAASWAADNVGRATAVVLVSDGYPTQCQPQSVAALADMAEMAHMNAPFVRTYVIGLGGDFNLDAIALGGGTHQAFLVDEGDFASSFTQALGNVANTKIACEYALPTPPDGNQDLDLDKVQVTYTSADDSTEEIPSLTSINGCAKSANGGWYYDDPQDPTSILVCPCTCSRFEAGRVDVRVGCRPRIGPR